MIYILSIYFPDILYAFDNLFNFGCSRGHAVVSAVAPRCDCSTTRFARPRPVAPGVVSSPCHSPSGKPSLSEHFPPQKRLINLYYVDLSVKYMFLSLFLFVSISVELADDLLKDPRLNIKGYLRQYFIYDL